MAPEKRPLKRKPLSDRTNIITDAATAFHRKSSLRPAINQLRGKPSSLAPTASVNTSTGSNATTGSSVRSLTDPPNRSSFTLNRFSHDDPPMSSPSSIQDGRKKKPTRKDKGKEIVEDSIIEKSHSSKPSGQELSSSHPSTPSGQQLLSSAASDDLPKSLSSSVQAERQNNPTRKDKGKKIMEDFIIEKSHSSKPSDQQLSSSHPSTPSVQQLSSSSAFDDLPKSPISSVRDERRNNPTRKHKAKEIMEDFIIEKSHTSTSSGSQPSSSPAPGTPVPHIQSAHTQRKAPQSKKDVGKKTSVILSCPPGKRLRDTGDELDDESRGGSSGMRTDPGPLRMKQSRTRRKSAPLHGMQKEEVERLKAYYADIDAFELPVEEAGDSDLD